MHRVVLMLGSNIDKEQNLPAAVRMLGEVEAILAVSRVYESLAMGTHQQPNFFNAAVMVLTEQTAVTLKDGLLTDIECQLGRRRTADKNAPRTIDLDIALFDRQIFDYTPADGRPRHIPEPDLLRFAHCVLPVADILPDMKHPETGETMRAIAERVARETRDRQGTEIWERPDIDLRPVSGDSP